jgi:hypothetical protein
MAERLVMNPCLIPPARYHLISSPRILIYLM